MAKETEHDPLLDDDTDETTDAEATEGSDAADDDADAADDTEQEVPATPARTRAPRATASPAAKVTAPAAAKQDEQPVEGAHTNAQRGLLSDAEATRRTLAKAKKVWFMVPLSPFEKEGAYEEVYINGYRTTIKKGVMVEIPQPVMEILANKYRIETEAGREFRIDRDTRTEDALS